MTLKLKQNRVLRYVDSSRANTICDASVDIRVIDESYPSTYIVRETILAKTPFQLFFICQ